MLGIGFSIFIFLFSAVSINNLGIYVLVPKNAWQAFLLNYTIDISGMNPIIYYHTMT